MIIVTLTTTPPNFFALSKYLKRFMEEQTVTPDRVIVNVPEEYNREIFSTDGIRLGIKSFDDRIVINRCVDSGPATKILGMLECHTLMSELKDYDTVIVIDDDIIYPPKMIEEYMSMYRIVRDPEEVVFGVTGAQMVDGYTEHVELNNPNIKQVNVLQGWSSYAMLGSMAVTIKEATAIHLFPDFVFYQDDIFLSNVLAKHATLRVIQTEDLWAHQPQKDGSLYMNPELQPNREVSDGPLQMHNDASLFGANGSDGNLNKNVFSMDFYVRKGLLNFELSDERKKQIVMDAFIITFYEGDRESLEDAQKKISKLCENFSVERTIQKVSELAKSFKIVNLIAKRFWAGDISHDEREAYAYILQSRGLTELLNMFRDKVNFTGRSNKAMRAAIVFHIVIDGTHGCHSRTLSQIAALREVNPEAEIDLYVRSNTMVGVDKQDDIVKSLGINNVDVFHTEEEDGVLSEGWSKHVTDKIVNSDYDLTIVSYDHVLTREDYLRLPEHRTIIDTHDDVELSGHLQRGMKHVPANLESLTTGRSLYSRKRCVASENYNYGHMGKVFISEQEMQSKGKGRHDVLIPYIQIAQPSFFEDKTYDGNPVMVASDNVFNIDAMEKLTKVGIRFSGTFDVYGNICDAFEDPEVEDQEYDEDYCVRSMGFAPSLEEIYRNAPFSVCPLVFGTGSKIKIQESLGYGCPVVAMIDSGLDSDIVHGVNGFLCYTWEEFLNYCHELNDNRDLAKKMGRAAEDGQLNNIRKHISFSEYIEIVWRSNV
jgi:hypothetical protein